MRERYDLQLTSSETDYSQSLISQSERDELIGFAEALLGDLG